jgi:Na+/proline symporter
MTDSSHLERRYRRLLAWYPRAFRHEHEEEMLAVLMAGARAHRRRPALADCADLIMNALWLRMCPEVGRSSRRLVWAVRLMVIGAVLELVALATVLATQDNLRSAILRHFPHFTAAQWHADVHAHILTVEVGAPIAAVVWLWLAWANGRRYGWAKGLLIGFFALTSVSLLSSFAQHAATYAPADLTAGCVLWLLCLVTVLLTLHPRSGEFGRRSEPRALEAS